MVLTGVRTSWEQRQLQEIMHEARKAAPGTEWNGGGDSGSAAGAGAGSDAHE